MEKRFNYPLFFLVTFLVGFGFLFLATISAPASLKYFGNTNYYLFHQLVYGLLPAAILGIVAFKIPLDYLKKIAPALLLLNLIVLLFVFAPFAGSKFWGAQRWLSIGKITFQPSEFLKITSILYLSAWIASRQPEKCRKGGMRLFIPFLFFLGAISAILYFQPDISTLGIISLTLLLMYFAGVAPLWHVFLIIGGGIGILLFLIKTESYRLDRWLIFLNPGTDPLGKGLQINQSLIAIGSGGFFGKGLGMSTQKFGFLPQAMSDSVFAVLAEETGIIGCLALIFLFMLFLWLGIKIAKSSGDKFSKTTALGIVFWITLQAFINIGSISGIIPISGIPLPFFSYGGSHLVAELAAAGLLLNISSNS